MAVEQIGAGQASSPRLKIVDVKPEDAIVTLTCLDTVANATCFVQLKGAWTATRITRGDYARVIRTNRQGEYVPWDVVEQFTDVVLVDDDLNLLIVHPDILLPGSSIADSVSCPRKTVLSIRNPAASGPMSPAAIFGNFIHELFQTVLVVLSENPDTPIMDLFSFPEDVLEKKTSTLYKMNIREKDALTVLHDALPKIHEWVLKYFRPQPAPPPPKKRKSRPSANDITIQRVHDIEELVWSPVTGLKGMIDATVVMQRPGKPSGIGVVELKTGKSKGSFTVSHHAQVALYKLLLSDRHETTIQDGIVTYITSAHRTLLPDANGAANAQSQNGDAKNYENDIFVDTHRGELVGLVMQRNFIAYYVSPDTKVTELPPVIEKVPAQCARCFVKESCLLQNRLLEKGTVAKMEDRFDQNLYERYTSHLTDTHAEYYHFWYSVLAAEEAEVVKYRKELWTLSGDERAVEGRCISNLKLLGEKPVNSYSQHISLSVEGKHVLFFNKHWESENTSQNPTHSKVSPGDFILLSVEKVLPEGSCGGLNPVATKTWKPALANGFVHSVVGDEVGILLDRNITSWAKKQRYSVDRMVWRIDSEEILASYRTAKTNLERLFLSSSEDKHRWLREAVVDCVAPPFSPPLHSSPYVSAVLDSFKKMSVEMNSDQIEALEMFERTEKYMLLLGFPGTGKSFTLAAITMLAVSQGKSVLLCSHTHSAVDTVLLKLLECGFRDFVRFCNPKSATDSRILPFVVDANSASSVAELESSVEKPSVVAVTCLGINNAVFSRRSQYDLVVVDEASQILQPIIIGPLMMTDSKFVLVGDHHQLPPLLRARRPIIDGLVEELPSQKVEEENVSLFERLRKAHPEAVVSLQKQYRMADSIMHLANELVYKGKLECGNERTLNQTLSINKDKMVGEYDPWLKTMLEPSVRALFINTDTGDLNGKMDEGTSKEKEKRGKWGDPAGYTVNLCEMEIILQAIKTLVQVGVSAHRISILSPFRKQVHLFRERIENESEDVDLSEVSVFTIDQYQGRDNDCIFVSFVRASPAEKPGPLLDDWRRINVAVTRAKKKLVLVGSRQILLQGSKCLKELIKHFETKNAVANLSSNVLN